MATVCMQERRERLEALASDCGCVSSRELHTRCCFKSPKDAMCYDRDAKPLLRLALSGMDIDTW